MLSSFMAQVLVHRHSWGHRHVVVGSAPVEFELGWPLEGQVVVSFCGASGGTSGKSPPQVPYAHLAFCNGRGPSIC